MKRVLIILGILIAAGAIIALGVWLRGGTMAPSDDSGAVLPGTLPLPTAGSGVNGVTGGGANGAVGNNGGSNGSVQAGISLVSQTAILDYAANSSGTLFMFNPAGTVLQITDSESVYNQGGFDQVSGGWFSPDGRWLLVKSGSPQISRWSLFDVPKKTWKDLPANTSEMFWSPVGNVLAYFARRSDGNTLTIFDPQKGTTRSVLSLAAPDLTLRWKNSSHILVMDRPTANVSGPIWDVDLGNGSVSVFAATVTGADVRWGGGHEQGLIFKGADRGGVLSLTDLSGTVSTDLSFLTFPSKCVFGDVATATSSPVIGDQLFCAVPQDSSLLPSHRLPDEYLKRQIGTSDAWYVANTLNGALRPLLGSTPGFAFDATNPKIYDVFLYFMNRNDQKLYRTSLAAMAAQ